MALLFFVWMLLSDRSGIAVMTILAALLHEGGHIAAARVMHIPLHQLQLDLLGARLEVRGRLLSYSEEWLLAVAGPLTSLLCALVGGLFWQISKLAILFSCASLLLGILNLLPIKSFDGGKMLELLLLSVFGVKVSKNVMNIFSFLFLFLLWSFSVYFLLRATDGLSLFCFSVSLLSRFFDGSPKLGSNN